MLRAALIVAAASAASAARLLHSPAAEIIPGEYIIRMRRNATEAEHLGAAAAYGGSKILRRAIRGFAAKLGEEALARVLQDPAVDVVGHNVKLHILDAQVRNASARFPPRRNCPDTQTEPVSWGQARVTAATPASVTAFAHDARWGTGVDIYVTDTGTNCDHEEFAGGRCRCGPDCSAFLGLSCTDGGGCSDGNGHGTYCASIAGGARYGIAKAATLIGVKVMGDNGAGSLFGILGGWDWAMEQAEASGRPSVMSCSLGTLGANFLMDEAADNVVRAGLTVSIAAGNSGEDAQFGDTCTGSSPGAAELPITVGSTTIGGAPGAARDARSSFSNYGKCVDVFAPGSDITAASVPGNADYMTASGTSAACPHVSGVAAALLGQQRMSPQETKDRLLGEGTDGLIEMDCQPGHPECPNSPNKMLHVAC